MNRAIFVFAYRKKAIQPGGRQPMCKSWSVWGLTTPDVGIASQLLWFVRSTLFSIRINIGTGPDIALVAPATTKALDRQEEQRGGSEKERFL